MTATLENTGAILEPHRFTVQEYQRIFESGILPTDQRSQLIRGEIYFMSAMGAAHYKAIRVLTKLLHQQYTDLCDIVSQAPIVVWDDSEPEPDFALVRSDFAGGIPEAKDALLAIEVSDSTLKFDREKKLPEYARSSIPEVWILNLTEAQLEVYREPNGEQFLQLQILKPERLVSALFAPEVTLEWWKALEQPKRNSEI